MKKLPFRIRISEYQRHRIREGIRKGLSFSVLVLCSAVLGAWIQSSWPQIVKTGKSVTSFQWASTRRPTAVTRLAGATLPVPSRGAITAETYSHYFEEALPVLRADRRVRLVKLDMPREILGYQDNASIRAGVRLQSEESRVPMMAVSRNAREFLTTMRIAFIDPREVPAEALKETGPLNAETVGYFLLVPELSAEHAAKFTVSRK